MATLNLLAAALADLATLAEMALAEEQTCNEVAEGAAMLSARSLADEQRHHKAAKCATALTVKAPTNTKVGAKHATALAAKVSADDKKVAVRALESTAATLSAQTLAEEKQLQVDADAAQH
jgi:hypothetical protein